MNDELQGVLAELASRLGTTSGELWSWLQSEGLNEYAKVKVAQLGVETAGWGLALLLCITLTVFVCRLLVKDGSEEYSDVCEFLIVVVIAGFMASITILIPLFGVVSELAGWMASPQGMVISTLLDKVG